MRTILHMSDIHFGKADHLVTDALLKMCIKTNLDLIVISGDLTQRARVSEFEEAQIFLKKLTASHLKILAIPGNHDIHPLYAPLARARNAYDRYNKFIAPLAPNHFVDNEVAVRGINTVRASRFKGGHVSLQDVAVSSKWFNDQSKEVVRILVTHHPLDLPAEFPKRKLARHAERGISEFAQAHIDVYLSGHYHRSSAISTRERYSTGSYGAIAVQAGTISTRSRGERQSFSLLHIERTRIRVTPYLWDPIRNDFSATNSFDFSLQNRQWVLLDDWY